MRLPTAICPFWPFRQTSSYDGPCLSIGFDLSVRDHLVSQVNQALMTLSDNDACVEAKPRAHRGRSVA